MLQHQTKSSHRESFGSSKNVEFGADLLEIQLKSFKEFFQIETTPDKRAEEGLYAVFQENFPITDSRNIYLLEFLDYIIDPPRYSIPECIERGLSYAVSLKAKLRLICNDDEHIDFQPTEQYVYLGNLPYMTPRGTFIINGAERVVVSQLHRSPGVFFGQSTHPNGQKIYSARVIPFKGAWMEFATDINNVLYAYIDRKKKFPVTTLLRAIGFESDKQILELFGMAEEIKADKKSLTLNIGKKLANRVLKTWNEDFVDSESGEISTIERTETILERDTEISEENIKIILNLAVDNVFIQKEEAGTEFSIIYNTLHKDTSNNEVEAVQYIYRQLRGTDAPDDDTAKGIIDKLFFSDKRYDLGEVGRFKINDKLNLSSDENKRVLSKTDIIEIIKYLIRLTNNNAEIDDIDHLSNRRVRTVGEQLSQQFSSGLLRMARTIRERMNVRDNEVFLPTDLVNAKTLTSVINSFFGTSQLSQFLDQTNPLSELTHKRRISALGPGGLSRERAGFEVRDVHYSHYGRLCPIETPEGPNIGLISTLCVHAKINSKGFIETPYYKVNQGKVDKKNKTYLSAADEEGRIIAQNNVDLDEHNQIKDNAVIVRETGEFPFKNPNDVNYVDVAPNQIMGLSASLIPFLEHNDANRALMGSNMQRQAVPLVRLEAPIVGTGYEAKAARDARIQLHAEGKGEVVYVDANTIKIKYERSEMEKAISFSEDIFTYNITKFIKTNQATCINLKPCVVVGQKVNAGDFLTEGYATKDGELALGRNLLVSFMPWKGYNFEDAIVINERVVREDLFTSIHIDDYELDVRDTKLGEEELTNDIPNISEDQTKNLDNEGIIRVGSIVREGDILIGKITPKGESDPTPEEKLLRAIFGDKAGDAKDASLRAPSGTEGTIINTKLFQRTKKDKAAKIKEKTLLDVIEKKFNKDSEDAKKLLEKKLLMLLDGKTSAGVTDKYNETKIAKGAKFTAKSFQNLNYLEINNLGWTTEKDLNQTINLLLHNYSIKYNEIYARYRREKFNISIGDELPTGVIKLAKVFIAVKRKLKVGDKMAGRHGNKGIVAKIVRAEDMPFLENGQAVDIVLNPLGVPSRMNLGQIYETVLGWVGKNLGTKFATPIFNGAKPEEIENLCSKAGIPLNGHTYLYDGETGERFHQKATVGIIYMIKLHHMVDDKMHARSIGPYSLITQQPLGGKAQFGGQRFGEMEVWALEAYGASNILQELLTIKSDDIIGRSKTYDAIVKGDNIPKPGIPESFNVLVHELRGLGLDLKFE
ncbi:MAG: DNA-directed RNA polymerase subunit beta [Alphaproteobacteria bacterium]|nr:DNA-directed RNA polymerase subunit beta [Alphaproteobacteria bacterium]